MSSLLYSPFLITASDDADSIIPLIVWGVIGIFWVIGQIANKKKDTERLKRQAQRGKGQGQPPAQQTASRPQAPSQAEPQSRTEVEDEMRRFLEQLTGNAPPQPARPAPKPQVRQVPPPLPAARKPEPVIQFDDTPPPTAPAPSRTLNTAADEMAAIDDSIYETDYAAVYQEAEEITDILAREKEIDGEALQAHQALVNVSSFITKLDTLTVPIMRTEILSMRPVRTRTTRPNLSSKREIRRAIVGRIILSPCKALDDDIFDTDKGGL